MADIKCLQDWVIHEMVRGRYIFTKEDVLNLHLPISDQALQNSLTRLTDRGIIMSPWQNFYVDRPENLQTFLHIFQMSGNEAPDIFP